MFYVIQLYHNSNLTSYNRFMILSADTILQTTNTDVVLLPGETILKVIQSPKHIIKTPPSTLRELYRLAQAKISSDVGKFEPIIASLSTEGAEYDLSEEFHRYEALFGRDSLRVAMNLIPIFPRLTHTTIMTLAELQGLEVDSTSEEEPGRIIHESRTKHDFIRKEITKKFGWDWPYYGSVDSTPEFIRVIYAYCSSLSDASKFLSETYKDKNHSVRTIADSLSLAVNWLKYRMDLNPEGFVESSRSNPEGIENQVWKDSWDSYFHNDGTMANHKKGVASIEVQRVVYDALLDAAELYEKKLNKPKEANELKIRAESLKKAIFKHFWTEDKGGYFVIGTDRDMMGKIRKLKVRASNMGHLLHSRLLEGNNSKIVHFRESVIKTLFSDEMLTSNGIRTLASDEVRYRPGAYHNGSIWLWDNFLIIQGLRNNGYHCLANNLSARLISIVEFTKKFPEFVRGDNTPQPTLNSQIIDVWDDVNQRLNRIEQPPQEVQAWSVAAIVAINYYETKSRGTYPKEFRDDFEAYILNSCKTCR